MNKPIIHTINGAKVVLYPMQEVEAVMVIARFHAGSWYEGKDWGAHHLLEHVMLDGSENFKNEDEIEKYKELNGLNTNGATGRSLLEFYFRSPKTNIKEGFLLLFDSMFRPLLRDVDIEKNKTIIAQEYKDKWSTPHTRFGRAAEKNYYGVAHPYMRDGMGEMEFVQKLKRQDLQKIHREYVTTENLTLVIVGNFNIDEVVSIVSDELRKGPTGQKKEYKIPHSKLTLPYLFWSEDVMKVEIDVQWNTHVLTENSSLSDKLAINIGRYILGGSARSRLSKELRTKRAWVYHAGASHGFLPNESYLSVNTSTDTEKASQVLELLKSETLKFVKEGIPDDEFERAKNYLNMQTLIYFDSVGAIANKLINDQFYEEQIYMPEELNKLVDAISKEDVVRLFSSFVKENPVISIMAKEDPHLL